MSPLSLYGSSLTLLMDLYELTMAAGYFESGMAEQEAVFQLYFRKNPFQSAYSIAAGLEIAIEFLKNFHFDESDLSYLASLKTPKGHPLFKNEFLKYLKEMRFECDVDAVAEGTVIFPHEPLMRVTGPILQAQILETFLINVINFQTLIATKASRISLAAHPGEVIEFGARRAQGIDGSLSASRAAFIGGCQSTSNTLAGKFFGIPVKGTQAHSWIMAFDEEKEAFRSFAHAMKENYVLLVDTYDSIKGIQKAIEVAKELEKEGIELLGVRLDSGDIALLSKEARSMLDSAGLRKTKIMASNELNEYIIKDVKGQGSHIDIWGVGTNLVTAEGQPSLGGIYKLTAIKESSEWKYKLKTSDQLVKTTNPGITQIRRFYNEKGYVGDMLFDEQMGISEELKMIELFEAHQSKSIKKEDSWVDLLIPIFRKGKLVYKLPSLKEIQKNKNEEIQKFPSTMLRFLNPTPYFIGMEKSLFDLKLSIIEQIQGAP